jgi:hypothetical protein
MLNFNVIIQEIGGLCGVHRRCLSTRNMGSVWWMYRDGGGVCVCVGVQGLCGGYIGMVGCMYVSEYKDCGVCVVWM